MANKRPNCSISSSDEELLMSGLFSDVTVKCGDRTWNLHRAILTRSPFFQKALEPNRFKESQEKHIEITEQDPSKVNWVIYFIYTGRASSDLLTLLEDNKTVILTCVELFEIADFFTIDTLCTHAVDVLLEHIIQQATHVQGIIRGQNSTGIINNSKWVDDDFCDRFLDMARMVYTRYESPSFQPLKNALVMFPELTRYHVLRATRFKQKFFSDPDLAEFARDILGSMFSKEISRADRDLPLRCRKCPQTGFIHNFSLQMGYAGTSVVGKCRGCVPIGNKDVMQQLRGDEPGEAKRQQTS
ncbi:hypothetical protein GGR58DRAFT_507943 [Xylaria digitata]|nr:hypothetical protein GGR58DRAFT_507943 [Xylaria digitata]